MVTKNTSDTHGPPRGPKTNKGPGTNIQVPGPRCMHSDGVERSLPRLDSALSPATWIVPRKVQGAPPAAVTKLDELGEGPAHCVNQPRSQPTFESKPARSDRIGPGRAESQTSMRLARRATRRLPLGEPPLVVTTHAITSFSISHLGPAGVQPRAEASSSPSYHVRTTRVGSVCAT